MGSQSLTSNDQSQTGVTTMEPYFIDHILGHMHRWNRTGRAFMRKNGWIPQTDRSIKPRFENKIKR